VLIEIFDPIKLEVDPFLAEVPLSVPIAPDPPAPIVKLKVVFKFILLNDPVNNPPAPPPPALL
jgi:hypothetical protein